MRIGLATKSKGFTLIELLIAVTIIGILAAAVSIGYTTHLRNARCSRILQDFDAIGKASETYREVIGVWADDVDPNPTLNPVPLPAFVPEYMPTWPSGDFYETNAYYDWENWDPIPSGLIKAITFRIPPIAPGGQTYFYCVQDERTAAEITADVDDVSGADSSVAPFYYPCRRTAFTTVRPLNYQGTCP